MTLFWISLPHHQDIFNSLEVATRMHLKCLDDFSTITCLHEFASLTSQEYRQYLAVDLMLVNFAQMSDDATNSIVLGNESPELTVGFSTADWSRRVPLAIIVDTNLH